VELAERPFQAKTFSNKGKRFMLEPGKSSLWVIRNNRFIVCGDDIAGGKGTPHVCFLGRGGLTTGITARSFGHKGERKRPQFRRKLIVHKETDIHFVNVAFLVDS